MICDARELFLKQHRFDLIFKYLYVTKPNDALARTAYLESIRAFNGYFEQDSSDGVPKDSAAKFLSSFDALIKSMRIDGFRVTQGGGGIPIGENGEILDGAHRLSVATAFGLQVETREIEGKLLFDYKFFKGQKMAPVIMDYGALEYVRLNPNASIVWFKNLGAFANPTHKKLVETILDKEGFVYYKKSFRGTTVYVFVCDETKRLSVRESLSRALSVEDKSAPISATHKEAMALAEKYFGKKDILRRLQYALQYNIYRKERRSDGVRSVYVFGVKLVSYRKR